MTTEIASSFLSSMTTVSKGWFVFLVGSLERANMPELLMYNKLLSSVLSSLSTEWKGSIDDFVSCENVDV
jgi:hypothetical protein